MKALTRLWEFVARQKLSLGGGGTQLSFRDLGREAAAGDQKYLTGWKFRTGDDAKVVWITHFGDLFVEKPGGIYLVEIHYGEPLKRVAGDLEELYRQFDGGEHADILRRNLFLELRQPPPDRWHAYGFKTPVCLGGKETVDNLELEPLLMLLARMAQLIEQLDAVPTGAKMDVSIEWPDGLAGMPRVVLKPREG